MAFLFTTMNAFDISTYDYELPDDYIARYPVQPRDQSKLLCYDKGDIQHISFKNIPEVLPPDSILVFNTTKVIHARLYFITGTGAKVEVFCLEPFATGKQGTVQWKCLIGNKKRWKEGAVLTSRVTLEDSDIMLYATYLESMDGIHIIEFRWENLEITFLEIIEAIGELPIPPYLNRPTESSDEKNYQTIFARDMGSVAAPTAALHFTDEVMQSLQDKGIITSDVLLHVGAGTFKPVKVENIMEHAMHRERVIIPLQSIQTWLASKGPIIPVGTTSMRSIESLYWLGVLLKNNALSWEEPWEVPQLVWQLDLKKDTKLEVLSYLQIEMEKRGVSAVEFTTSIMIAPGYTFSISDGLITNFHQPKSTLMCLVAALVSIDKMKIIYQAALENKYRFLSYGDSSLLLP